MWRPGHIPKASARALHRMTVVPPSSLAVAMHVPFNRDAAGTRRGIRPFEREDIPGAVALRQHAFRLSERPTAQALAAHFESVFFDWPWPDAELPSLAYVDERGQLLGFIGVLPRPMRFRGETLRAAVTTQFMVAPHADPLVAVQLARTLLAGPQDLTLADAANDAARRMWTLTGGGTAWVYSLLWLKPLRAARYWATERPPGRLAWAARLAARPLARGVDLLTRPRRPATGGTDTLDAALMAGGFPDAAAGCSLYPQYEATALDWVLGRAAEKTSMGTLQRASVRDDSGQVAGWFLYFLSPQGVSQVLQIAARREAVPLVLEHLWYHAASAGAVALEGRVEPALLPALAAQGCRLERRGPWTLCAARRPELELAIQGGDAFLSRLEGEWWLSF
jgi:hypothetical protein